MVDKNKDSIFPLSPQHEKQEKRWKGKIILIVLISLRKKEKKKKHSGNVWLMHVWDAYKIFIINSSSPNAPYYSKSINKMDMCWYLHDPKLKAPLSAKTRWPKVETPPYPTPNASFECLNFNMTCNKCRGWIWMHLQKYDAHCPWNVKKQPMAAIRFLEWKLWIYSLTNHCKYGSHWCSLKVWSSTCGNFRYQLGNKIIQWKEFLGLKIS